MFRPVARVSIRTVLSASRGIPSSGQRFLTTEAPHLRSRSWKSSAARWGIAIAGIYYYNTSPVFAEHPQNNLLNPNLDALEDSTDSDALDVLVGKGTRKSKKQTSALESVVQHTSEENASTSTSESSLSEAAELTDITDGGSPAALEQEAESEGAFNPETGEINWDCPCLGGMAHGPCGPEFREAFSCFVFSKEEPKGMDCIEKFQGMQECFAKHPEIYKEELEDEEQMDAELEAERQELVEEIAQRKKQAQEASETSSGAKPPSEGSEPKTQKKSKSKPESTSNSKSRSEPQTSESMPPPPEKQTTPKKNSPETKNTSTESRSAMNSAEHDQHVLRHHGEHITDVGSEPDEHLVPKAAHDARGHVGPAKPNTR